MHFSINASPGITLPDNIFVSLIYRNKSDILSQVKDLLTAYFPKHILQIRPSFPYKTVKCPICHQNLRDQRGLATHFRANRTCRLKNLHKTKKIIFLSCSFSRTANRITTCYIYLDIYNEFYNKRRRIILTTLKRHQRSASKR